MSSKSSILYIPSTGEHWYFEHVEPRDTVILEVDSRSVQNTHVDEEHLELVLKPDSPLAKLLNHPTVKSALDAASKELGFE